MKTMILCMLLVSSAVFSQEFKKGDQILLTAPIVVQPNTKAVQTNIIVMNNADGPIATHLEEGYIYNVLSKNEKSSQLKAVNFSDKTSTAAKLFNSKIYTVLNTDLTDNYEIRESMDRLSIGIITLPFKYRPQEEESFETEFNINTTLNIFLRELIGGSFHFQIGTGFGSVRLDSKNSSLDPENTVNAISLGFITGAMMQYKNVQFGLYSGVDIINNNSQLNWSHNGKLWFGLGIGFNLFKINIGGEQKNQ